MKSMQKFFEALANVFRVAELRSRVLFTLGLLAVYRLGAAVPIPGVDAIRFEEFFQRNSGGLLGYLDMFSGGQMRRLTVFRPGHHAVHHGVHCLAIVNRCGPDT